MNKSPLKILLIGANGRLGQEIDRIAPLIEGVTIVCRTGGPSSSYAQEISSYLPLVDIVLDVSTPSALQENLPKILEAKKPLVIGSTGHNAKEKEVIEKASTLIPLLVTANFSFGIRTIKTLLPYLPHQGSFHISETHHKNKKDAPSGTALELLSHLPSQTSVESIREDSLPATHTITLSLPSEEIIITHKAYSREVFAKGALKACLFLAHKPIGLYTSFDDAHR